MVMMVLLKVALMLTTARAITRRALRVVAMASPQSPVSRAA
jgi:hypothetical protein